MLYNTQMEGASPNRYLPATRRKRFRQATTRSLGTRSNRVGAFFFSFLAAVGLWGEGWHGRGGGESDNYDDYDKRRLLTR